MHTEFWSENSKERDNSKDLSVNGSVTLNCIFKK
jgi:hypothetical protein